MKAKICRVSSGFGNVPDNCYFCPVGFNAGQYLCDYAEIDLPDEWELITADKNDCFVGTFCLDENGEPVSINTSKQGKTIYLTRPHGKTIQIRGIDWR